MGGANLDFDIYLENLPKADGAGLGLVDFQFTEVDNFGFRLVIEANADGTTKDLRLEHNTTGDTIVVRPPLDSLPLQTWTHVRCETSFLAGKPNQVEFRMYFGGAEIPTIEQTFDSPFSNVDLARVRLLPFDFPDFAPNPGVPSHGLYYDSVTLQTIAVPPDAKQGRGRAKR
jgi:hypothetical protein